MMLPKSGTKSFYLYMLESQTPVTLGVVDKLAVSVLKGWTFLDRLIK